MFGKNNGDFHIDNYVNINGAEHYLLHIPSKASDPVFLFIHGGPGQAESSLAYLVDSFPKRNYNIVYYDQRGAGKTYLKNKRSKPDIKQLKKDLLQVVLYVKDKYKKDKIIILGHSFGTVLGSMFALEHPEHVLCYIGCGQLINFYENEAEGYQKLSEAIRNAGNIKDQKKLDKIGSYPAKQFSVEFLKKMNEIRKLQGKYHLTVRFHASFIAKFANSPIVGLKDFLPFLFGSKLNAQVMADLMQFDLSNYGFHYQMPVYYIFGTQDHQTPAALSTEYFNKVTAPDKKLFLIENAGHLAMLDNTEDYRKTLSEIAMKFNAPNS